PPLISSRPAIMRSKVDLPQPDGPRNTMNSPVSMVIDTLSMTCTEPKCLLTLTSLISAKSCLPSAARPFPGSLHGHGDGIADYDTVNWIVLRCVYSACDFNWLFKSA